MLTTKQTLQKSFQGQCRDSAVASKKQIFKKVCLELTSYENANTRFSKLPHFNFTFTVICKQDGLNG